MFRTSIGPIAIALAFCAAVSIHCGARPTCDRFVDLKLPVIPDATLPAIERHFLEAAGCGGRVWMRSGTSLEQIGALWSMAFADPKPVQHIASGVLDIHRASDDELYVLYAADVRSRGRTVAARLDAGVLSELPSLDIQSGDTAFLIADDRGRPFVLGGNHVYTLEAQNRWTPRRLSLSIDDSAHMSSQLSIAVPRIGDVAYVGFDRGEFGGGVRRVNLSTGEVRSVGSRESRSASDALLTVDNDTVTAMVADSEDPACVLVASGSSHLGSTGGRVVKVCGDVVKLKLQQEFEAGLSAGAVRHFESEPVYDLAGDRVGAWAVTPQAVYRLDGPGPFRQPIRSYERRGGLMLNREIVGVAVICATTDMSGNCTRPLVVPSSAAAPK